MINVDTADTAKRNTLRSLLFNRCESIFDSASAILLSKDRQDFCVQRDQTDSLQSPTNPANQNSKYANQNAIAMRQIDAPRKLHEILRFHSKLKHWLPAWNRPHRAEMCENASESAPVSAIGFQFVAMRIKTGRISLNRIRSSLFSSDRIKAWRIKLSRISLNRIRLDRISLNRISLSRIKTERISLDRIISGRIRLFLANQLKIANQHPSHSSHGSSHFNHDSSHFGLDPTQSNRIVPHIRCDPSHFGHGNRSNGGKRMKSGTFASCKSRGIFSEISESAEGNRNLNRIMDTVRNLLTRIRTSATSARIAGTSGAGGATGRQSGRWLSSAHPVGVFAILISLFIAVGFNGGTLAQEAVLAPVPMFDSTQFNTLLSCFGAVNVLGGTMFWVLFKRIDGLKDGLNTKFDGVNTKIDDMKDELKAKFDSVKVESNTKFDCVKELIVKNAMQNQNEHAALEKQNQKEHAALEMKIIKEVGQSEANVKEKINQLDNTVHKLIGQLQGRQLIPNTETESQTGSNEGVQTATA